jgi:hypothetical protein
MIFKNTSTKFQSIRSFGKKDVDVWIRVFKNDVSNMWITSQRQAGTTGYNTLSTTSLKPPVTLTCDVTNITDLSEVAYKVRSVHQQREYCCQTDDVNHLKWRLLEEVRQVYSETYRAIKWCASAWRGVFVCEPCDHAIGEYLEHRLSGHQ